MFTGCSTRTEYVFVEAKCPKIEVLQRVDDINGSFVGECLCGDQLYDLMIGTSQLRKSETYYIDEITKYNEEFTSTIDK